MCNTTNNPRYCYRCNTCLAVFVSTEYLNYKDTYTAQCKICDSVGIESMGKIGLDQKLTENRRVCKCDDRCVWAKGPVCNCMCGGANHQSGPHGYTRITRDLGIAKLTCTDPKTVAKHQKMADEFMAALSEARKRQTPRPAYSSNYKEYAEWRKNTDLINKATNGKSHNDRLKKLAKAFQVVEVTNTQTEQKTC